MSGGYNCMWSCEGIASFPGSHSQIGKKRARGRGGGGGGGGGGNFTVIFHVIPLGMPPF